MRGQPRYVTYKPLEAEPAESGVSTLPTDIWAKFEDEPGHIKLPCVSCEIRWHRQRECWLKCEFETAVHRFMDRAAMSGKVVLFGIENGDRRTLLRANVVGSKRLRAAPGLIEMADYQIEVVRP